MLLDCSVRENVSVKSLPLSDPLYLCVWKTWPGGRVENRFLKHVLPQGFCGKFASLLTVLVTHINILMASIVAGALSVPTARYGLISLLGSTCSTPTLGQNPKLMRAIFNLLYMIFVCVWWDVLYSWDDIMRWHCVLCCLWLDKASRLRRSAWWLIKYYQELLIKACVSGKEVAWHTVTSLQAKILAKHCKRSYTRAPLNKS